MFPFQRRTNHRWPVSFPAHPSLFPFEPPLWTGHIPSMTKVGSRTCGPETTAAQQRGWGFFFNPNRTSNLREVFLSWCLGLTCVFQDVLNNSDHQAVLFLGNMVEGKYRFRLTVTDSKGQSNSDSGTVEVKAGNEPRRVQETGLNKKCGEILTQNYLDYFFFANILFSSLKRLG